MQTHKHIYYTRVCHSLQASPLIKIQLRLSSHLSRMIDIRIPKQLLLGQFSTGRSVGRLLLRFKEKLKENLKR